LVKLSVAVCLRLPGEVGSRVPPVLLKKIQDGRPASPTPRNAFDSVALVPERSGRWIRKRNVERIESSGGASISNGWRRQTGRPRSSSGSPVARNGILWARLRPGFLSDSRHTLPTPLSSISPAGGALTPHSPPLTKKLNSRGPVTRNPKPPRVSSFRVRPAHGPSLLSPSLLPSLTARRYNRRVTHRKESGCTALATGLASRFPWC
jgi:hypothetical protein